MPVTHTKDDDELIKYASRFVYLRPADFAALTGRAVFPIRRRLRKLLISRKVKFGPSKGDEETGLGYFYRLPNPANPFEKVFYLTQKGWDRAARKGFITHEVNANREKEDGQLEHDLLLTDLHLALHRIYGDRLYWDQTYRARYHRFGKGQRDYVNADAFFFIRNLDGTRSVFFVEVERQGGVQEPLAKMEGYVRFADGHFQKRFELDHDADFRVIFLKNSAISVENVVFAARASKRFNTRKFWATDFEHMLSPNQCVFVTPRDFETTRYSLDGTGRKVTNC